MQVTVKLATREGAAHISGILAGFTLLAKRGELTLRVLDARQGSPIAREALLETEIDGRTVVFDLMDGYFYNDPAAVQALFSRADVVFKRSFSAEKNRQFPGDISAKLRPLGLNYYVTCPGSPLEAERSAKSRLKQWALSTRCYPQDFEARLTRVRKKPRILFLTRLWDPEEPAVLPEEIAFRKKLGFIVPIRIWMADERYNQDVRDKFHSEMAAKFFNLDEINAIFEDYIGGNSDNWRKVWTIYTFLVWYEEYFVKR